jgi:uncharacterized membrane protein
MEINREAIKRNAKLAIQGAQPKPFLVGLLYLLVIWVLQLLSAKITGQDVLQERLISAYLSGGSIANFLDAYAANYTVNYSLIASLLNLAISLIGMALGVGFTIYVLQISRMQKAGFENLLDGFGIFFKAFLLYLLMGIFFMLWSLLLIIPGIVALYRYRQAVYIMLDHPEYSALQCIRESKKMMQGRKGELFVLALSFFGWYLLPAIPLVSIWVTPYTQLTYAFYYNALLGLQPGYGNGGPGSQVPPRTEDGQNRKPPWEY